MAQTAKLCGPLSHINMSVWHSNTLSQSSIPPVSTSGPWIGLVLVYWMAIRSIRPNAFPTSTKQPHDTTLWIHDATPFCVVLFASDLNYSPHSLRAVQNLPCTKHAFLSSTKQPPNAWRCYVVACSALGDCKVLSTSVSKLFNSASLIPADRNFWRYALNSWMVIFSFVFDICLSLTMRGNFRSRVFHQCYVVVWYLSLE